MLRIIGDVEPRGILAENVQRQPIASAADDLRALGYITRITCLDAAELAAPHRRVRWWLAAYADRESESRFAEHAKMARIRDLSGLDWWEDIPASLGVDDGLAGRMERLRCLGNGQLPQMVRRAWLTLLNSK